MRDNVIDYDQFPGSSGDPGGAVSASGQLPHAAAPASDELAIVRLPAQQKVMAANAHAMSLVARLGSSQNLDGGCSEIRKEF